MAKVVSEEIEAELSDHVFVVVKRPGRQTVTLDLHNTHGRAVLWVRTNGHFIASVLCDVELKVPKSDGLIRYCPMCGEKLNHLSSKSHVCKEE